MKTVHIFQRKYRGHLLFIYEHPDEHSARDSFVEEVFNVDSWIYLGKKIATEIQN